MAKKKKKNKTHQRKWVSGFLDISRSLYGVQMKIVIYRITFSDEKHITVFRWEEMAVCNGGYGSVQAFPESGTCAELTGFNPEVHTGCTNLSKSSSCQWPNLKSYIWHINLVNSAYNYCWLLVCNNQWVAYCATISRIIRKLRRGGNRIFKNAWKCTDMVSFVYFSW